MAAYQRSALPRDMKATCDGCAEHKQIIYRGDVHLCATCMANPWKELLEAANDVLSADLDDFDPNPALFRLAWAVQCIEGVA